MSVFFHFQSSSVSFNIFLCKLQTPSRSRAVHVSSPKVAGQVSDSEGVSDLLTLRATVEGTTTILCVVFCIENADNFFTNAQHRIW